MAQSKPHNPVPYGTKTINDSRWPTSSPSSMTPNRFVVMPDAYSYDYSPSPKSYHKQDAQLSRMCLKKLSMTSNSIAIVSPSGKGGNGNNMNEVGATSGIGDGGGDHREQVSEFHFKSSDVTSSVTIHKLQTVNEKFTERVQDLEEIVKSAIEKAELPMMIYTHRKDPESVDVQERNSALKAISKIQTDQRKQLTSLRNRLEALQNIERVTDMQNEIIDLERQAAERMKMLQGMTTQYNDQVNQLQMLEDDTEYQSQAQLIEREINKWKEKYRMMQQVKREEEFNFKEKFDQLNNMEGQRFEFKTRIIQMKNKKSLSRVQSQDALKKTSNAKRSTSVLTKIKESAEKRNLTKKRMLEVLEQHLKQEIERIGSELDENVQLNQESEVKIKELSQMVQTLRQKQHHRQASQEDPYNAFSHKKVSRVDSSTLLRTPTIRGGAASHKQLPAYQSPGKGHYPKTTTHAIKQIKGYPKTYRQPGNKSGLELDIEDSALNDRTDDYDLTSEPNDAVTFRYDVGRNGKQTKK